MRFAGRITEWNDDKGFGFITPNGGGEKVFVHVSAIARGAGRPGPGYALSYGLGTDNRGRVKAVDARPEQARRGSPASLGQDSFGGNRLPKGQLGVVAYAGLVVGSWWSDLPSLVTLVLALASPLAFLAYGIDKRAARAGRSRTPETTLHLLSLLGGWPGALAAQHWLRHKSVKKPFLVLFWITVAVNLGLLGWFSFDGGETLFARW